jgi:hypothetical protein
MKLYLAAQYGRKEEIKLAARLLTADGHEITSTWINEPYPPTATLADLQESKLRELAEQDLSELHQAEGIVFFSEDPNTPIKRGGRHVEFGFCLAFDKRLVVVGPRENIFHYLSDVEAYPSLEVARVALRSER